MGLNALKINSCVPILVMCWFEEKIDARTDNLLKNRGQHQSQWILMKDAAFYEHSQAVIFKVSVSVGSSLD